MSVTLLRDILLFTFYKSVKVWPGNSITISAIHWPLR